MNTDMTPERYRVTDKDGREIRRGDGVTSFRGIAAVFEKVIAGPTLGSSAKVKVMNSPDFPMYQYNANVFGLTVERVSEKRIPDTKDDEDVVTIHWTVTATTHYSAKVSPELAEQARDEADYLADLETTETETGYAVTDREVDQ